MIDSKQTTENRISSMIEELKKAAEFASDAADSARDCGWLSNSIKLDWCSHILTDFAEKWERMLNDHNDR